MKVIPNLFLFLMICASCDYVPTYKEKELLNSYENVSNEVKEIQLNINSKNDLADYIDTLVMTIEGACVKENTKRYFSNECGANHMIVTNGGSNLKKLIDNQIGQFDENVIRQFSLNQSEQEWVKSFENKKTIETLIFLTELKLEILKTHANNT
jgi:hypothetical protein